MYSGIGAYYATRYNQGIPPDPLSGFGIAPDGIGGCSACSGLGASDPCSALLHMPGESAAAYATRVAACRSQYAPATSNTKTYVIVGVGVAALLGALFLLK